MKVFLEINANIFRWNGLKYKIKSYGFGDAFETTVKDWPNNSTKISTLNS